ncbi:GNAT family N-acetyltransferase [Fimbriimonas ginsengisoli]|uniref:Acetyltransferase involved in intracellular survival n=1 Tax=Fimbriimonas ginsengisoli Gsoil 348 TaxID=661478 RepID=A0A068NQM0_FIMGI|nr:GNAT family N-acetyltransferase [Fimbriimonas ginsengisoli]AIE85662.1 acetyltransferase involved in intracellular survival [Fimbriimonas ginsengisoli Gsoil 348]
MIEVRTIRNHEAEPFLELLCDVFGLDYQRAYDVFFSEPLFDLHRKWALFDGAEMVSILTTTPLRFGWGRAFGIAGVATRQARQREGYASKLLQHVLREGRERGESAALLFAREPSVYERNGFEPIDQVIRSRIKTSPEHDDPIVEPEEAELIYDAWAALDPNRLRRDVKRWEYWRWNFRVTTEFDGGYLCHEPGNLRECIFTPHHDALPLPEDTEWFGLASMAAHFAIPLVDPVPELTLMGYQVPDVPQMFMTDQF